MEIEVERNQKKEEEREDNADSWSLDGETEKKKQTKSAFVTKKFLRLEYREHSKIGVDGGPILVLQRCTITDLGMELGIKFIIDSRPAMQRCVRFEKEIKECISDNSTYDMIWGLAKETLTDLYMEHRIAEGKRNSAKHVLFTDKETEKRNIKTFLASEREFKSFKTILFKKMKEIFPTGNLKFFSGLVSILRNRGDPLDEIEELVSQKKAVIERRIDFYV